MQLMPVFLRYSILGCAPITALMIYGGSVHAQPQRPQLVIEHIVEVRDPASRLFHVTSRFSSVPGPHLDLALPVWTPGVYTPANYALNAVRLTASDGAGTRLRAPKHQPSTWRIDTTRARDVVIEFDYSARTLSWNEAGIAPEFAFFTGTQLFLEPVGHRNAPATVRFVAPNGWRIATALRSTADPSAFTAANYDELVDAPTVIGSFDVVEFDVDGKPHSVVTTPAGAYDARTVATFAQGASKIIRAARGIFGSLPYDRYTFFHFAPATGIAGGNLEHANASIYASGSTLGDPDLVSAAHEFFHLWNVKRIRPAEMWPYDYSRVTPGPSLWMSEGVTSYYERLIAYRAGIPMGSVAPSEGAGPDASRLPAPPLDAEAMLLQDLAFTMSAVETNPDRAYVSPADSSISGGLAYGATGIAYATGKVLGALLDLSIRHDTAGRRGLDDMMRTLYAEQYLRGRGFTPEDLPRIVGAVAGRNYNDFFMRHVTGTELPPYERIFAYAGYRVVRLARTLGVLGVTARSTAQGRQVYRFPEGVSPGAQAGVRVGDVIVAVNGVPIHEVPLANLYGQNWIGGRFPGRAGERVVVTVLRNGQREDIAVTLGTRDEVNFRIEPDPGATAQQLAVRRAWLSQEGR